MHARQRSNRGKWQWIFHALLGFALLTGFFAGFDLQRAHGLAPAVPMDPEKSWKKAQCDGKYAMLRHQFKVEKDGEEYGEFKDLGYRNRRKYAGQDNLSSGWWVYVQPYWYIWGERTDRAKKALRNYGPEQMIGEPNVTPGSSSGSAWCPLTTNAEEEWVLLEYDTPVKPIAVLIHENSVPGGVAKVTAFKFDGTEVEIWKGEDPTNANAGSGVSEIECKADFKTNRIKIYIDSKNIPGWHEIDAVGLRDEDKKTHWVAHAVASSTYAPVDAAADRAAEQEERISNLEEEVQALRKTVEELKKQINRKEK